MLGRPPDGFVAPTGLLAVRRVQALRVSTRHRGAGHESPATEALTTGRSDPCISSGFVASLLLIRRAKCVSARSARSVFGFVDRRGGLCARLLLPYKQEVAGSSPAPPIVGFP